MEQVKHWLAASNRIMRNGSLDMFGQPRGSGQPNMKTMEQRLRLIQLALLADKDHAAGNELLRDLIKEGGWQIEAMQVRFTEKSYGWTPQPGLILFLAMHSDFNIGSMVLLHTLCWLNNVSTYEQLIREFWSEGLPSTNQIHEMWDLQKAPGGNMVDNLPLMVSLKQEAT